MKDYMSLILGVENKMRKWNSNFIELNTLLNPPTTKGRRVQRDRPEGEGIKIPFPINPALADNSLESGAFYLWSE